MMGTGAQVFKKFFENVKLEAGLMTKGRLPKKLPQFDELIATAKKLDGPGTFDESIYTLEGAFDSSFDKILDSMEKRKQVFDALLVWEENNPSDSMAVCVYVEGLKLGYVTHLQYELVSLMKRNGRRVASRVELKNDWRGGRIDLPETL